MNLAAIKLLILDVDGVLTDGRLSAASEGGFGKAFHARDGCAIKLWQRCGGKVAILSGRADPAVGQRAKELGIEWVHAGVVRKLPAYEAILASAELADSEAGYVGDDWPDMGPMSRCGLPVAVADAVPAVKRIAVYVTRRGGGRGVIAEVVEWLLRKQQRWSRSLAMDV